MPFEEEEARKGVATTQGLIYCSMYQSFQSAKIAMSDIFMVKVNYLPDAGQKIVVSFLDVFIKRSKFEILVYSQ